ncbi:MAG TPA: STAS domain-containing protein [Bacteroidota bacterium]|nr:STAS domain-containing protein [Bacteroidota bacterium]
MRMKEKNVGGIVIIALSGDLLGEPDTKSLREKIYDLVKAGLKNVIIDMNGLNYTNSAGLGALISALTTMRKNGGDLRLAGLTENVSHLFSITQLMKVFYIYGSVKEATDSYANNV